MPLFSLLICHSWPSICRFHDLSFSRFHDLLPASKADVSCALQGQSPHNNFVQSAFDGSLRVLHHHQPTLLILSNLLTKLHRYLDVQVELSGPNATVNFNSRLHFQDFQL